MSQSLSGLVRRALPLAQQLERSAAPAGLQHFSSAAEGDAAGSSGAPRAAAASSGAQGSPGSRGPRRDGPQHRGPRDGGARGDGQRRPHGGRGGGDHRGGRDQRGGGGGGRAQRGGGRDQRSGGGWRRGGEDDSELSPELAAARAAADREDTSAVQALAKLVPAELRNLPAYQALTQFKLSLRNAKGDDIMEGMDLTDIANMDHLPLAKYYCTDREWADFAAGRLDEEEEVLLLERMSTALLADEHYAQKQATVATAIDQDPDYDLAASLSSVPQLRGSPRPQLAVAELAAALGAQIEEQKGEVLEATGLSEEEFAAAKEATVKQQVAAVQADLAPPLPDHIARSERLTGLLDRALPRDHPSYGAIEQRLAVLQANPGWPHERKMVFAKRLIKRMAAA